MKTSTAFFLATAAFSAAQGRVQAQVNVLTQANDQQRTGANLRETVLNTTNVPRSFGLLWKLYSDAHVMTQPLYVSNLKSAKCPGGCNTVAFCSMKGTIYLYMADQRPTTANDTLVWARYLGDPRPGGKDIDMWSTDDPWWGILGTPVIDLGSNSLWVVAWNPDNAYRLYKIDLANGNIKAGARVIAGSVGAGGQTRTFDTVHQKQRPGLLLMNGSIFVSFGGDRPRGAGPAGWVFVYDSQTLTPQAVWTTVANGDGGGLWQSGRAPVADNGFIYLQTGNGDFDSARQNFGDSLLKLSLQPSDAGSALPKKLVVEDFFTPCDQALLNNADEDLGSAGPVVFLGNRLLGGGKQGRVYSMTTGRLGKFKPPAAGSGVNCGNDGNLVQQFQGTIGHIHGSPVFWKSADGTGWIYEWGESDRLHAFPFRNGAFHPEQVKASAWGIPRGNPPGCASSSEHWMPGGIMSISANGSAAGSAILWGLVTANGDANQCRGVKGMLIALDAADVTKELWRSQRADATQDTADSYGLLARFCPPTIANGKVFVATFGDAEPLGRYQGDNNRPNIFPNNYYLAVFGLKR